MKLESITIHPYHHTLTTEALRQGAHLRFLTKTSETLADLTPLPSWSQESLKEALSQLNSLKEVLLTADWSLDNYEETLQALNLFPSLHFAIESALLSLLDPLPSFTLETSALLMGTPSTILSLAEKRHKEGYKIAKLKLGNLSPQIAHELITTLSPLFRLRLDLNKGWEMQETLRFFSQYPITQFDFVEEPFQDAALLPLFSHPLAIDESYSALEIPLPSLKAIVYKPTLRGGLSLAKKFFSYAQTHHLQFILSSSFESPIGLMHIADLAYRLNLTHIPAGLGTYHYLQKSPSPLKADKGLLHIPKRKH